MKKVLQFHCMRGVINAKKYMAKAAAVTVNSVFPSASAKAEVVLGGFYKTGK